MCDRSAYYSLVQFCPDASRRETVNVGLILLCPSMTYLNMWMLLDYTRVAEFFGPGVDLAAMEAGVLSLCARIISERSRLVDPSNFSDFIRTRANEILLTELRPVRVCDPKRDIGILFDELVTWPPKRQKGIPK